MRNVLLASALVCGLVGITQAHAQQGFPCIGCLPGINSIPQPDIYRTFNSGFGNSTTYGPNGFTAQTYGSQPGTIYVQPGYRRW